MALQNVRSSTADKRPNPASLSDGQLAINTAASTTGLFYKNASGALVKAGPVYIGTTAPNATPASGGHAGNSVGETWLDTAGANPILKVWDGSTWRVVQPVTSGTVVSTADTGTVTSTMIANGTIVDADVNASAAIAGTKVSPNFGAQNVTTTGTSTAASYNPTSSTVPANGVFLPAANSIGLATNSVERFRIDSAGQIEAAGLGSAAAPTYSWISDPNTGIYSPGADQVAISTNGAGRLFVDASGNIGIRRSTARITGIDVDGSIAVAENNVVRWLAADGTNRADVFSNTSGDLIARTGASLSERLRITSAGLVGIGTSVPNVYGAQLSVIGGSIHADRNIGSGNAQVQLSMGASSGANFGQISNTGTRWALGYGGTANTVGTEVLVWNSAGNVGIGTTPDSRLHVVDGSGNGLRIGYLPGSSNFNIYDAAQHLFRSTTGTEYARIDSSGRLLLGTSTGTNNIRGAQKLALVQAGTDTVSGLSAVSYSGSNTQDAPTIVDLCRSRGSTDGSMTAVGNGDSLAEINFRGSDGTGFITGATIKAFVDGGVSTNDLPTRLVFSTSSDGASSPTERLRITSTGQVRLAGAGITFNGDTATANELDDYEEGTWTPAVVETTPTASYTTRLGVYTKIGQQVHVGCTIVYTGGTGSGGLVISGLPFTSRNTTGLRITSAVTLTAIPLTTDNVPYCEITANSSQVAIGQMPIAGGSLAAVPFDPAGSIFFTISYVV